MQVTEADKMRKRRRTDSPSPGLSKEADVSFPDVSQQAQLGTPVMAPSPTSFPELLQATKFAELSPRASKPISASIQKQSRVGLHVAACLLLEAGKCSPDAVAAGKSPYNRKHGSADQLPKFSSTAKQGQRQKSQSWSRSVSPKQAPSNSGVTPAVAGASGNVADVIDLTDDA